MNLCFCVDEARRVHIDERRGEESVVPPGLETLTPANQDCRPGLSLAASSKLWSGRASLDGTGEGFVPTHSSVGGSAQAPPPIALADNRRPRATPDVQRATKNRRRTAENRFCEPPITDNQQRFLQLRQHDPLLGLVLPFAIGVAGFADLV